MISKEYCIVELSDFDDDFKVQRKSKQSKNLCEDTKYIQKS